MPEEPPPQRVLPMDPSAPPQAVEAHAECGDPRWDGVRYVCPVHGVALLMNRPAYEGSKRPGFHAKSPPVVPASVPRATTQPEHALARLQARINELEAEREQLRAQLEATTAELREALEADELEANTQPEGPEDVTP